MTHAAALPSSPGPSPPAHWRERTLARLVTHVRSVLPVSAVAFVTADSEKPADLRATGWFATEDLRAAVEASVSRMAGTPLPAAAPR